MTRLSFRKHRKEIPLLFSSFIAISFIFVNLSVLHSPFVGTTAFLTYVLINGYFLSNAFFEKEQRFLKLILGTLFLIAILGLVGWLAIIIYNLDDTKTIIVLSVTTLFCAFANLKKARAPSDLEAKTQTWNTSRLSVGLVFISLLYLLSLSFSFYLLIESRRSEVYTVWQFLNPLFFPVFLTATVLLLVIALSTVKSEYKLAMIIIHSILSHMFFVIVFPVGDTSYQAQILAASRLVYDNAVVGGLPPWHATNILGQIWYWFRGTNFQTALSTIFARTFAVDLYWSHSLLVPIIWAIFVPTGVFMITKMLSENERISFLSALLASSFSFLIYYGALSTPNSLGFIFFLFAVLFIMKYLSSNKRLDLYFVLAFAFVSFISHFLTGLIAVSFLLIAITIRNYGSEKTKSVTSARLLLGTAFVLCTSIVPLALVYERFFYPITTRFSFDNLSGLPLAEVVQLFIFGEYVNLGIIAAVVLAISPLIGFLGMIYYWRISTKHRLNENHQAYTMFFLLGFLIVSIDYRIVKLLMVDVPFNAERFWVFRDLLAVSFAGIFAGKFLDYLQNKMLKFVNHLRQWQLSTLQKSFDKKSVAAFVLVSALVGAYSVSLFSIGGWVTVSVYYGYPHFGPLQITSYEAEAVKFIDQNTTERYVVIGDYWILTAGQMFVGVNNPRAYYSTTNPNVTALFISLKNDTSLNYMVEAMKINNAKIVYFVIQQTRLGAEVFNRIVNQATANGLNPYETFGDGKLYIFRYKG